MEDVMSLAIERFTVEPGSSLVTRDNVSGYFVEFQLLDYDYGELETQSVVTSPHSTQPVLFNFKTGVCVCVYCGQFVVCPSPHAQVQ